MNLQSAATGFTWPIVLLTGDRDLRTPPPIAERVASAAPGTTLVRIENGHSALETHPEALLAVAGSLAAGTHAQLEQQAAELNRLPRRGFAARSPALLAAMVRAGL